jgi:AcrR family transcriptional regulator
MTPGVTAEGTVARLLDAAEAVFEERGFAGARMDEIAARARMAKSHVYYHFAGKQAIFDELVRQRIAALLADKDELLGRLVVDPGDPDGLAALAGTLTRELFAPRAAFLRIVLVESLGSGRATGRGSEEGDEPAPDPDLLLMRVVRPILADIVARFQALGYDVDRDAFVSQVFFFGIVPAAVHTALATRWATAAGIDPVRADHLFYDQLTGLQRTHLARLSRAT